MTSIIIDPACTDDERREALYAGDIFVHTASPAIAEFVAFTRGMVERRSVDSTRRRRSTTWT